MIKAKSFIEIGFGCRLRLVRVVGFRNGSEINFLLFTLNLIWIMENSEVVDDR